MPASLSVSVPCCFVPFPFLSPGLQRYPFWFSLHSYLYPLETTEYDRLYDNEYELQITNYGLRITDYGLRITDYELRIKNYGYELQITARPCKRTSSYKSYLFQRSSLWSGGFILRQFFYHRKTLIFKYKEILECDGYYNFRFVLCLSF